MPPQSDGENVFRFTDPRQKRIVRRLALIGPGPVAFYRDACRVMEGAARVDSTPHLVAHLLREIESAIRAVLVPHDFVPPEECQQCGNRPEAHKRQIEAILRAYDVGDTDIVAVGWRKLAGRDDEMGLARFAHRDALGQPRRVDETFRKLWDQVQTIFDLILERFETRFLESFRIIDDLLVRAAPTAADAGTLRNRVPHNLVTLEYFFSKAQSPAWLEPLAAEGLFRHPPELLIFA